jgi:hypothetical protein
VKIVNNHSLANLDNVHSLRQRNSGSKMSKGEFFHRGRDDEWFQGILTSLSNIERIGASISSLFVPSIDLSSRITAAVSRGQNEERRHLWGGNRPRSCKNHFTNERQALSGNRLGDKQVLFPRYGRFYVGWPQNVMWHIRLRFG